MDSRFRGNDGVTLEGFSTTRLQKSWRKVGRVAGATFS
jgi:hypothetical protein